MGDKNITQEDFDNNIVLERRFARILKAILGNYFITQDVVLDKEQGTDFAIMTVNPFKVGIRLRRYKYWLNWEFRNQFTIRWKLASGNKTEIDKIRSGFVRYILYGFVNEEESQIIQYFIGDLSALTPAYLDKPYRIFHNKNSDDSDLAVYRLCDAPIDFIVKKWTYEIV